MDTITRRDLFIVKGAYKLTEEDHNRFVPKIEHMIKKGKIRILLGLKNLYEWTGSPACEDTKFRLNRFSEIKRLARVGEKMFEKAMTVFCKAFSTAEIRFFEHDEFIQAKKGLKFNKKNAKEVNDKNDYLQSDKSSR